MKLKRIFLYVLCMLMLLAFTACGGKTYGYTPAEFLSRVNDLCVDDFGILTVKENVDSYTERVEISEKLEMILTADAVTQTLYQAELVLTLDGETEKLDYSSFSYFFLIMIKAYNSEITVANINSIYNSLGIETYESGTDTQIGYGSNVYFYKVTDGTATFTAQYSTPSSKEFQPY